MTVLPWLLWGVVLLPLVGAVGLAVLPRRRADRWAAWTGVSVGAVTLGGGVALAVAFEGRHAGTVQFDTATAAPALARAHLHLGLDGLSLPYLLLTAVLALVCLVLALRQLPPPGRPRAFTAVLLTGETGLLATFAAQDLLAFFVAFDVAVAAAFFLIGIWGGPQRVAAATTYLWYAIAASVALLAGFLIIYSAGGSFDLTVLGSRAHTASGAAQTAAFTLLLVGFGVKCPLWPLHGWLPGAHTEAPTAGSVLMAGVLLKTGSYGLLRIAVPLLPTAAHRVAPWLATLAVISILVSVAACLGETDLKRVIAYSSIGHMGFVLLGIASLTPTGRTAAAFGGVAHGLVVGLLFLLVGGVRERRGSSALSALGGGATAWAPRLGWLLTLAVFAGLGLPGLAGFWAEAYAIGAALHPAHGLPHVWFAVLAVAAAAGTVGMAAAFARVLRRVCLGEPATDSRRVRDALPVELAAWLPLAVGIVVLGLWPLGLWHLAATAVAVPPGR